MSSLEQLAQKAGRSLAEHFKSGGDKPALKYADDRDYYLFFSNPSPLAAVRLVLAEVEANDRPPEIAANLRLALQQLEAAEVARVQRESTLHPVLTQRV